MFTRLEKLFRSKLDEVVFIELKPDAKAKINQMTLDPAIPLPVMFKDVMDKVQGVSASDITAANMIKGMAFILSVDEEFPHKTYYHDVMLSIDDKIGMYLLKHAFELANEGNKVNALIYFKASLMFIDNEIDVLTNYGRCCVELAYDKEETEMIFIEEAKEVFESMIQKYPEQPYAYYHLGFIYSNEDQYKLAEAAWVKAIKLNIGENEKHDIVTRLHDLHAKIKFEEGHTLIIDGRQDEGLEILLALEPEYVDWWNLMFFIGLGYRMNNDFDNALKYYSKVMELNTGHVQTYNEIGLCYMTMGRFEEAVKAFKEALKMDRENSEILCNLGIVYIQLNELDEAENALMRSFKADTEDEITASWIKKLNELRMLS
ncbi:MAG: tetratricopeptide repeat protein [Clostridiales bacterium]|nr:tetratricopeptide repeat protein [Clostridiales bacterium]